MNELSSSASADTADTRGWRALISGGNGWRALVVTGGVSVHAVSIYVVATIMPVVVADIGGIAFFAWTATLYIAASLCGASAIPLLVSRAGPRRAYLLAFALFMAGSLTCSLAIDMPMLLVGRLLQGLGGGMLPALGYATIRSMFPPQLHARAIAVLGSVWGIAALLGPTVGGVFAQFGAWRAAFWIDFPIALGFAVVAARVVPRRIDDGMPPRPFPGWRLATLAAAAIAVSAGGVFGRALPAALGVAAAVLLVLLVLQLDNRASRRMLPRGAFNPGVPIGAVSATMGLMILAMAPGTFIPYILREAHGVAPIVGGYINALLALSWTAASLLTASAGRARARATMVAGPFLMAAGLLLHAWALPSGLLPVVAVAQLLVGFGIGIGWAHLGALLMEVAPAADRDTAGPFITTTQTLAAAFGSAVAGMVANTAGLASAASPAAVGAVAPWLYGIFAVFALVAGWTGWRTLTLTRR